MQEKQPSYEHIDEEKTAEIQAPPDTSVIPFMANFLALCVISNIVVFSIILHYLPEKMYDGNIPDRVCEGTAIDCVFLPKHQCCTGGRNYCFTEGGFENCTESALYSPQSCACKDIDVLVHYLLHNRGHTESLYMSSMGAIATNIFVLLPICVFISGIWKPNRC